ncbi:hypothetical protein LSCM1_01077 [Leishmania martiniquensis]|uniref:Uncharacterized protein n=1 Tax=Leishmania martiniquensis TaxID=1580590 RepID=A0A836GY31_9TRYP|nr:hypothetical protein LSCM1_01077 [Leishmania martiniquensis]
MPSFPVTSSPAAVEAKCTSPTTTASPSQSPLPPHRFSAEAAPFVPSYMRDSVLPAAATPVEPAPPIARSAAGEDGDKFGEEGEDTEQKRFSKMWVHCLEQVQGDEVGLLMDMMPPDIQELYSEKLSEEYLLNERAHNDKGVHALQAAQKMVQELTPEQFNHIEEFLEATDALNLETKRRGGRACHLPSNGDNLEEGDSAADDGDNLFMHDDDGMDSDEEAWLLEQMMEMGDTSSDASQ